MNSENRYGTYLMYSSDPMESRAIPLRTKPYTYSPANCSRPGTTSALRDMAYVPTRTSTAESTIITMGLVTPAKMGGRSKAAGPGGLKPPAADNNIVVVVNRSPFYGAVT